MILPYRLPDIMQTIRMNCRHLLRHCRLVMCGEQTDHSEVVIDVSDSSCSVILIS